MSKLYDPSDTGSSPYEPMIGAIILYRMPTNRQIVPGIITNVRNSQKQDRCDLTIFTPQGVVHIQNAAFSSDHTQTGVWFWAETPQKRDTVPDTVAAGEGRGSNVADHDPAMVK